MSLLTLSPGQSHTFPERQEQVGSATFVMPIDHVSGSVGSNTFSIDVPEYAMGIEVNLHFLIDPQENEGFKARLINENVLRNIHGLMLLNLTVSIQENYYVYILFF